MREQVIMDRIRIVGGERLEGTIPISGAKNAALPLMIASLLTHETLTLHGMPRLADVALARRAFSAITASTSPSPANARARARATARPTG